MELFLLVLTVVFFATSAYLIPLIERLRRQ